jgi:hypothetical protein
MLQSLKRYSRDKIISSLLSLATNCSNENLVRMTYLMELIPSKEYYKDRIRWIRGLIRENHPAIEFPRRILRDLQPNQRDKWITNLVVNHLLSGTNKRKSWLEREGYYPPSTVVISPTMKCLQHRIDLLQGEPASGTTSTIIGAQRGAADDGRTYSTS